MKRFKVFICIGLIVMTCGCQRVNDDEPQYQAVTKLADLADIAAKKVVIVQNEIPIEYLTKTQKVDELPPFQVESLQGMGWNLMGLDLSQTDLADNKNLIYATFNEKTIWPNQLPDDFDPQFLMEQGKNPGLGIREIHKQGITGKGVNIAIIDQTLDSNHQEYKDQLMLYEKLHVYDDVISMHGPAVASLAVGKSIGVAPDAKLYFIACDFFDFDENNERIIDFNYLAQAIERVIEINQALPEGDKIRVLSISRGYNLGDYAEIGAQELYYAIEKAKAENIYVITTSTDLNYDYNIFGMGRKPNSDPDDLASYTKGIFWSKTKETIGIINNRKTLLVPMDGRTYADMSGDSTYTYGATGGFSWSVPWLAGMYALCLQVDPTLSPDTFNQLALDTGDVLKLDTGEEIKTVINPQRLIEAIKNQ